MCQCNYRPWGNPAVKNAYKKVETKKYIFILKSDPMAMKHAF